MGEGASLLAELARLRAALEALREEVRVLRLANASLAQLVERLEAAQRGDG
jgi:prefoldin subunit 5